MDRAVFDTSVVVFTLSLLAVGLRLYSRKLTRAGLGWDDGLILIATTIAVALFGLSIFIWNSGYDRISLAGLVESNQAVLSFLLVFQVLYLISMCLVKLSALCLYKRIFIQEKFQSLCTILAAIAIFLYIAVFVETVTISEMADDIWDNPDLGKSINKKKVDIGIAIFNVLGNVVVVFLPIPPIWKLQMRVRTKISLTILFCLGLCVTVVSFLRLTLAVRADYSSDELIAYGSRDMHLQVLEPELAIFSLCLPVLHPLWRKLVEKYRGLRKQTRQSSQTSDLTPLNRHVDDGRSMDWMEALAHGGLPQYHVSIKGGRQTPTSEKQGQNSPNKIRRKRSFLRSPSREARPPQLPRISVGRTFDISYEAATAIH
ncbi:hypothetical protein F5Y06DRAFT_298164 [Hypoxylon sp. FL0890]|nr:hypothetical protein F5Y06DRAFT_298164 [Hypoxylon sp. FL0890]